MKTFRKFLWVSIYLIIVPILTFSQTIENSYLVNQQVTIGGSSLFYVQISGAPTGAIITNVEVKFEYIAYGVVQNYVSCRFDKGSDPGTSSGILLVSQGSLPSGNPGTWGYNSYSNWNNQSGINTNYYFRFNLAASSPYTCTINKIYVKITYTQPTLTVTAPNGGETWYKGTNYTITWSSSNITGNVQIDLYKGGSNVLQLAASASNTGSYTFNPPTSLTDGSDYKIGISAMSGSVSDFSNNYFTISSQPTPTLTVTAPNGGETWYKGTNYTITWSSSNITGNVQIDLYKGGSNVLQLAASASNTGSYTFNPPTSLTDGSDYKIGISAMSGSVSDFSNNYYSIASMQSIAPPILISPSNSGTLSGPPYIFTWQPVSGAGAYQIKISDNNLFNNPLVNDWNISGSTYSYQTNINLSFGQTYFWQMRALDNTGVNWSSWGQYQVFTISNSTSNSPVDDYPTAYKNSTHCDHYVGSTYCPGTCEPDIWNFYRRECTSFVAWRINRDNGYTNLTTSDPFQNASVFGVSVPGNPPRLSDAVNWANKLQLMGYTVNNTPFVGDIAYFNIGHVAYVNSVNQDGTVNLEEYNWYSNCNNIGIYNYRTTQADKYIHIRQGTGGSSGIQDNMIVKSATIFPNPTNNELNINFESPENLSLKKISIINVFGSTSSIISTNESNLTIDLTNYSTGLYLIIIEIDGKIETHKIMKQ